LDDFAAGSEGLAHGGEIAQLDFHAHCSSEAKGMNRTVYPLANGWPAGVSITPSPQTIEVSTPELWLGNTSSPPCALRRARRNSRRRSARGQSKSARIAIGSGATRFTPCRVRRKGRTSSR